MNFAFSYCQSLTNLPDLSIWKTDNVKDILPDYLTLLHGVIDSPDIPLNVSRSYLQSDANVKKVSNHITKKVAEKLEEMFKNDREDFEKKWDDIKVFIEYGSITDEKARNTVALYSALLGMNQRAGADGTEAVQNAGYVMYAYLGGQARRDITYTREIEG